MTLDKETQVVRAAPLEQKPQFVLPPWDDAAIKRTFEEMMKPGANDHFLPTINRLIEMGVLEVGFRL
jgi:hypothetical protein